MNKDSVPPSAEHQVGHLRFELVGVGFEGLPAVGVIFPQGFTEGGLLCLGEGLLWGLSLPVGSFVP